MKWSLNFAFTQAGGDIFYHPNDIRKLVYNDDKISSDPLKHFSFVFVFYLYYISSFDISIAQGKCKARYRLHLSDG